MGRGRKADRQAGRRRRAAQRQPSEAQRRQMRMRRRRRRRRQYGAKRADRATDKATYFLRATRSYNPNVLAQSVC